MQTTKRPLIQSAIRPPSNRSLPQMLRAPLPESAALFRPPLPVRQERMSVVELRIYQLLRVQFVLIPLVAGIDKFSYSITDWDRYVPTMLTSIHIQPHPVMVALGIIEIAIALLVAVKPKIGSVAMILMLGGIMLDLLAIPKQIHLVLLDICLCVSSLCLFLLASKEEMLRRLN